MLAGRLRIGGEPRDEDGQAAEGELAAPVGREVDAVEALEVGFYDVSVVAE